MAARPPSHPAPPAPPNRLLAADGAAEADEAARLEAERVDAGDGRRDCPEWWRFDMGARTDAPEAPLG